MNKTPEDKMKPFTLLERLNAVEEAWRLNAAAMDNRSLLERMNAVEEAYRKKEVKVENVQ